MEQDMAYSHRDDERVPSSDGRDIPTENAHGREGQEVQEDVADAQQENQQFRQPNEDVPPADGNEEQSTARE